MTFKQKYLTRIVSVEALQLVSGDHPGEGTAQEMAVWCNGRAQWNYDAIQDENVATVHFEYKDKQFQVLSGDWLVKRPKGDWIVLTDEQFIKVYMESKLVPKDICEFCLADMQNTQMSDMGKKCPNCSSGYTGNSRHEEYQVLIDAGGVSGRN